MRLYFPLLSEPLSFEENLINVLIIEEPFALRTVLKNLTDQINGFSGDFILSVSDTPQEMSKFAEILIDPLHPAVESKRFGGKMLKELVKLAHENESELYSTLASANSFATQLSLNMKFPITFDPIEDPAELLRVFSFKLDTEGLDTPELLLEWMLMQREFFGKRLFILYGLKTLLGKKELALFYRNVLYEKLDLLLLEPFQKGAPLKEEKITIIDEDLCIIT